MICSTVRSYARFAMALLFSLVLVMSALTLAGCGGDDSSASATSTASTASQDNCYGDDLPATKSTSSAS